MKTIHKGQKGFTLIELLVVIAILGVIAAVVALNVAGFFGRGTLQAANTELHQAQTAIISMMADAQTNRLDNEDNDDVVAWAGERGVVTITFDGDPTATPAIPDTVYDAADYIYGPLKANYVVVLRSDYVFPCANYPGDDVVQDHTPGVGAVVYGWCDYVNGWGGGITWDATYMNWKATPDDDDSGDPWPSS